MRGSPCGEIRSPRCDEKGSRIVALARRPFYVTRDGLGQPILDLFA